MAANAISATLTGTISPSINGIAHLANGVSGVSVSTDSTVSAPKNIIVIGDKNSHVYDQQILIGFNTSSAGKTNGIANGKAGDTIIGNRITLGGGVMVRTHLVQRLVLVRKLLVHL